MTRAGRVVNKQTTKYLKEVGMLRHKANVIEHMETGLFSSLSLLLLSKVRRVH